MEYEVYEKLKPLKDVVKDIPDGAHIALSGFAISRGAIAFVHELIRQGRKDLTISQSIGGLETDLLVCAERVKVLNYGGGSLDKYGPINCVNRAIENKEIVVNEHSYFSMTLRFLAGALGLTFIPGKSMIGSSMLEGLKQRNEATEISCPFTGEKYIALKALQPDFAAIHVQKVDLKGNAILEGAKFDAELVAKAAKKVIVIAEEITTKPVMSEQVIVPYYRVDAVVIQPFGAYPTNLYNYYYQDAVHIRKWVEHSRNPTQAKAYIEEYILGVNDFKEFINKATDPKTLIKLVALAKNEVLPPEWEEMLI